MRLRVGDYRVIYEVHDDVLRALVLKVAAHKDAYRRR
ncbi:MAG: type II toxin-antitoxin system RelE family toxin [Vulcanimicrobiaceae bacterium]